MTASLHGLMAEFDRPEALLAGCRRAYEAGYRRLDAYSPFPIEGLSQAIGFRRTRLPMIVLGGAIVGAVAGYLMQYYLTAIDFPLNVGGRPLNSWPAFLVITFEMTILFAALSAAIGMLALNGLPRPHHPVFGAPGFEGASRDRFFLCIEAADPLFDAAKTRAFLQELNPQAVTEVAA